MKYKIMLLIIVTLLLSSCSLKDECQDIEDLNQKDFCYMQKATEEGNAGYCNKFSATPSGSEMRYYCLIEIAKQTGDKSLCDFDHPYYAEECLKAAAVKSGDPEDCTGLGETKDECIREATIAKAIDILDPQLCEDAGRFDYDIADCITQIALITKNKSVCDRLYDGFGGVRSECFKQFAQEIGDITVCEESKYDEDCFRELSSPETYKLCGSMESISGSQCYLYSTCKKIGINSRCYDKIEEMSQNITELALTQDNASICEDLGEIKPLCYYQFASKLGFSLYETFKFELYGQNEEICNKLEGKGINEYKCIFNFAIKNKDLKKCNELNGFYEDRCRLVVSLLKDGASQDEINKEIRRKLPKIYLKFDWEGYIDFFRRYFSPATIHFDNVGTEELNARKFNIFQGNKLTNVDGCLGGGIIEPYQECELHLFRPLLDEPREITYDRKVIIDTVE